MPVIFARPQGYEWLPDEIDIMTEAKNAGVPVTFLEWTDDVVDRVAFPGEMGGNDDNSDGEDAGEVSS